MAQRTQLFMQMPWNGGVNTTLEESLIDPNELTIGNNVELGVSGARKKRDGLDMNFDDGLMEVTVITTVADVSDSLDGTSFLIHDDDGSVGVWIDVDDSGTTIPAGAAAADRAIEITGIATDDTATTVADVIATALQSDSKFVSYNNGSTLTIIQNVAGNRTDATDASGGEATGFTFSSPRESVIRLHDFHYGATNAKTQRIVSVTDQNTFFQHESDGTKTVIPFNSGATPWASGTTKVSSVVFNNKLILANDVAADVVLKFAPLTAVEMDDLGGTPPLGGIVQTHIGRLWMNDKSNAERIHYSTTANAEEWQGTGDSGGFDIGVGDGDSSGITAIFPSWNGVLYVAKRRRLYKIVGFAPEIMEVQLVSDSIGCISQNSVVQTDNDIYWVSERGVHSLRATNTFGDAEKAFVSRKIQKTFNEDFSFSRLDRVHGAYLPTQNSIGFTFTQDSVTSETNFTVSNAASVNNAVWLYNVEDQTWYRGFDSLPCEAIATAYDADKLRFYIGADQQRVIKTQTGSNDDVNFSGSTVAIPYKIVTGRIFLDQNFYKTKSMKQIAPIFKPPGVFTVTVKVDNLQDQAIRYEEFGAGAKLDDDFTLDQSVLGADVVLAPFARTINGQGRSVKITVEQSDTGEPVELQGISVEYDDSGVIREVR